MLGKVVDADQIWNKDYIYLDWNVIKYLKEPRPDKEKLDRDVYEIVMKLNKKYVFPFSEAHIEDRCNNFKEEYLTLIQDDLQFVSRLSNDYCVAQSEDGEELKAIKYDVISLFNSVMSREKVTVDCNRLFPDMVPFQVDIQNIELDYVKDFWGEDSICDHEKLVTVVKTIFSKEISNNELYKAVRDSKWSSTNIEKKENVNDIYSNMTQKHFQKMVDCIRTTDESFLAKNWRQAVYEALTLHYYEGEIDEKNLMQTAYCMLDFSSIPKYRDKIKKKNNFTNIYRDSKNVWYASQAKMFVSEDDHTREKAKLIYKAFNKSSVVLSMEEFKNRMEYMI